MVHLTDSRTRHASFRRTPTLRLAIVSTYAPRRCGIATFTEDLRSALVDVAADVSVSIYAVDRDGLEHPDEVDTVIRTDVADDYRIAARRMAATGVDAVLIQHEYGIFGGPDGAHVLILARELARLGIPYLVTLHTVLSDPSPGQSDTLRALCDEAAAVTVFAATALDLIARNTTASPEKVVHVPHGAPEVLYAKAAVAVRSTALRAAFAAAVGRPVVATFGLLGPGKGIETAITALAPVAAAHPEVCYIIAGATHPEQVRLHGEAYRRSLEARVAELGLAGNVVFVDDFLSETDLAALLRRAEIYLTPYPNREQISSGTLTFAIAAGCAIVSTDFHYARDMVTAEMGALVPVHDAPAMTAAVTDLLDDRTMLRRARAASARVGEKLSWPAVASSTLRLVRSRRAAKRGVAA